MYTAYQAILNAEDGEYIQETFQTENSAIEWCENNKARFGEGQHLFIRQVSHKF